MATCAADDNFRCHVIGLLQEILSTLSGGVSGGGSVAGPNSSITLLCDPTTGAKVLVRHIFASDGTVESAAAFNLDGTPYGGSISLLVLCPDTQPFAHEYPICDAGTPKLARVCFNGCAVVSVQYFTLGGIATTAPASFEFVTYGPCPVVDVVAAQQTLVLCSVSGGVVTPFLRHFIRASDGELTIFNSAMDGETPFNPISIINCSDANYEVLILCDDNGAFLRHLIRTQTGTVTVVNTLLNGTGSYVPSGNVNMCMDDKIYVEQACISSEDGTSRQVQLVKFLDAAGVPASYALYETNGFPINIDLPPGDVLTLGTCVPAAVNGVATRFSSSGSGTIFAGMAGVTVTNVGVADGVFMGQPIKPGEFAQLNAYYDYAAKQFVRLPQITYDGTGTQLRIIVQE